MARKPPNTLRAIDLVDAYGAADILGCSRSRIHQFAEEGRLKTYIFKEGELVEAEDQERKGQIAVFDRYDVARLRENTNRKGGRPRKTNLTTS